MTEQQYREYKRISEEIQPIKSFLEWCGNKYKSPCVGKYRTRVIGKKTFISVGRKGYGAIGNTELLLPPELQEKVIEIIEDYVSERERELNEI